MLCRWPETDNFMSVFLLLTLISIFNIIIRFFNSSARFNSSLTAFVPVILYFYLANYFKRKKIALISSFIFSLLPQTVALGRIASPVNFQVFLFLLFLICFSYIRKISVRIGLFFLWFYISFLTFRGFWFYHSYPQNSVYKLMENIFNLTSFNLLFFNNVTYYWGGVRENGILYIALLPFFLIGLFTLIRSKTTNIISVTAVIFILTVMSPSYPESKEIFMAFPMLSAVTGRGFYELWHRNNLLNRLFTGFLILFLIYETAQFLHYYFIHFPLE